MSVNISFVELKLKTHSRSLGLEAGAAIGLPLFFALAIGVTPSNPGTWARKGRKGENANF